MTRLLGIDLGARRVGLAVADTATAVVRPLATIRRSSAEREAATLARLVQEQQVDEVVIGLPLNSDGSEGPQAAATRSWAAEIVPALGLPCSWRDETFSSQRAETRVGTVRRGRSGGPPSPAARQAHRATIDRQAAALILQAELDARAATSADR
ncbi:MAG: Holliday junction resolvase RuvX [Chloroflexota bacterium]|nr:Holliday junction resolvase RuvX [Chloroflexota bacterium]